MTYDPPPISVADIMPFFYMFLNTLYDKEPLVDACSTMAKEARERAQQGYGVVPKGAPRIIFPLVPNVDTGIVHTIENLGLAIPTLIMMYQTQQEKSHKKAATDPLTRIVEAYLGRPWYTHNFHPFKEWVKQMAEKFDADGILWFQTSVCRVNSAENPIALRKAITEEMGLPFVLLEGDYHCTRVYRPEDMETKIETFAEVVKARQAARQRQD